MSATEMAQTGAAQLAANRTRSLSCLVTNVVGSTGFSRNTASPAVALTRSETQVLLENIGNKLQ